MSNKKIGIKLADGSFYPILEKGIPEKKVLELTTVRNDQTTVQLDLYESDSDTIDEAGYVGTLLVENLLPRPKETPTLNLKISLNESDVLSAEIEDAETGEHSEITVSLVSLDSSERTILPDFAMLAAAATVSNTENKMSDENSQNDDKNLNSFDDMDSILADDSDTLADFSIDDVKNADSEPAENTDDDVSKVPTVDSILASTPTEPDSALSDDLSIPEEADTVLDDDISTSDSADTILEDDISAGDSADTILDDDISADIDEPVFDESEIDIPVSQADEVDSALSDDLSVPEEADTVLDDDISASDSADTILDDDISVDDASAPDDADTILDDFDMPDFSTDEVSVEEPVVADEVSEDDTVLDSLDDEKANSEEEKTESLPDLSDIDTNFDAEPSLEDTDLNFTDDLNSSEFELPPTESENAENFDFDEKEQNSAETIKSPLYDEDIFDETSKEKKKKVLLPILICSICAVICIVAILIFVFLIKPKQNAKKPAEPEVKIEVTEETEDKNAAKEDEIVIVEAPVVEPVNVAASEEAQEVAQVIDYKIVWGDTLWDISKTYYKTPWMYQFLADYNHIKNPDLIIAGKHLDIPPK